MKIAVADNCSRKFSDDIINHFEKKHEVQYQSGASAELAQWADLYYIDWADNNLAYLYKLYTDDRDNQRPDDWDNNKKPMIVVRAIDWELWTLAMHRDQERTSWVDKWICIAPHIEEKLRAEADFRTGQLKLIRPGVNLDKFTLKTTKTDGFQIGMVLGDFWPQAKNHMGGLDIFTTLYKRDNRWRLHLRGQHEGGDYWPKMYEHYLDSRGIRDAVTLYPHVDDMNEFYEKIDILLHPGMKESFCYAVGEAMAKGLPVVCNEFYGSKDIWPVWILYQTHEEAVAKIQLAFQQNNREWIEEMYPLDKMLGGIDKFLGT